MNYLDEIAEAIKSEIPSANMPDEDATGLFRIYAVLLLAKGRSVTLEDVHNAWSAWMSGQDPHHESIRPFRQLNIPTREEDQPFLRAILATAKKLPE